MKQRLKMFISFAVLAMGLLSSTCVPEEPTKVFPASDSCVVTPAPVSQAAVKLPASLVQEVSDVFEASRVCWDNSLAPQMQGDLCQLEKIQFVSQSPNTSSEGQRVLVIDSGMKTAAFMRYHKRVLDFLTADTVGNYAPIAETLELPRWIRIILKDLLGDKYSSVPTHLFTGRLPAMDMAMRKYSSYREIELENVSTWKEGHGGMTFSTIAEYSPDTEFVLALYDLPDGALYCSLKDKNVEEESIEKIGQYFRNQSDSLKKWIKLRQINFINFSANTNSKKLGESFDEVCNFRPVKKVIEKLISVKYDNFIKPLSEIPGVIFVQATENDAQDPVDPEAPGYLMTCGHLDNRILVGTIGEAHSHLSIVGNNDFKLLTKHQRNLEPCVDLYVNAGVDCKDSLGLNRQAGPNPVYVAYDGIVSASPLNGIVCSWSTSAAAPVALSHLIYLKNNLPGPVSTKRLLECANHRGQGKLKDPALYKQFESYRLGRME